MEVQHGNSQQIIVPLHFALLKHANSKDYNYEAFRLRGSRKSYQWKRISEVHKLMVDIQTAHDKLGSQDGNSREHEIKVPNDY